MPAYLIVDIEVRDPAAYEAYKREVPRLVAKHGGEYLVRGGAHEVIEGTWQPNRLVLFRFPSRRAISDFVEDPEYVSLKALRQRVTSTNMVAIDGVEQP